jgi:hypothetical protein
LQGITTSWQRQEQLLEVMLGEEKAHVEVEAHVEQEAQVEVEAHVE